MDRLKIPDVDYNGPIPTTKHTRPILKDGQPIGVVWVGDEGGPVTFSTPNSWELIEYKMPAENCEEENMPHWIIDKSIQGGERKAEIDRRDRAWAKIQKEAGIAEAEVDELGRRWMCEKGTDCEAGMEEKESGALGTQVGGGHYKDMKIQPVEFIHANNIGFIEGCVIKYVARWRTKGGLQDLNKAKHFIDLLIDLEGEGNERLPID